MVKILGAIASVFLILILLCLCVALVMAIIGGIAALADHLKKR